MVEKVANSIINQIIEIVLRIRTGGYHAKIFLFYRNNFGLYCYHYKKCGLNDVMISFK